VRREHVNHTHAERFICCGRMRAIIVSVVLVARCHFRQDRWRIHVRRHSIQGLSQLVVHLLLLLLLLLKVRGESSSSSSSLTVILDNDGLIPRPRRFTRGQSLPCWFQPVEPPPSLRNWVVDSQFLDLLEEGGRHSHRRSGGRWRGQGLLRTAHSSLTLIC
jgi:hypothetical protein